MVGVPRARCDRNRRCLAEFRRPSEVVTYFGVGRLEDGRGDRKVRGRIRARLPQQVEAVRVLPAETCSQVHPAPGDDPHPAYAGHPDVVPEVPP